MAAEREYKGFFVKAVAGPFFRVFLFCAVWKGESQMVGSEWGRKRTIRYLDDSSL